MPSIRHETLVELFRYAPEYAVRLLADVFGIVLAPHATARVEPADHVELTPTEHRADEVVVLLDAAGRAVQAVVVEVQLNRDRRKRRTWPVYLTTLEARFDCPAVLLVVCVDDAIARWCAEPIVMGQPGWVLRPTVLGPDLIVVPTAPDDGPAEAAVLAALAHGAHRTDALDMLAAVLGTIDPDRAVLYSQLVLASLPEAARRHLEELMATGTFEYQSDFTRRLRAEGRVEGRVAAVLTVLDGRGITVPAALRERIESCRDLDRLDHWLRRAATATSVADLDG